MGKKGRKEALAAMKEFKRDRLTVKVLPTRAEMGRVAAQDVRDRMLALLAEREEINMIFAAAPSQNEVLASLAACADIPWGRVNAFHMDEYIGLDRSAPQGFGNFLVAHLFGRVPFKSVNLIDCTATDPEAESERYAELLRAHPADIVVMGIGENGHVAFNDPPVADFDDPRWVKPVKLDDVCRRQQVNDGCFAAFEDVPERAMTLTCPTLMRATWKFCIVPAATKAEAVLRTLTWEVGEACPATVLRRSDNATLYLEPASAAKLPAGDCN